MRTVNTIRTMDEAFEMAINELVASIRFYMADGMSRDMAIEKAKKETALGPACLARVFEKI